MKRTLEAVLDANVINSISRAPSRPPCDRLSKAIEGRRLRVCVDRELGIVSEWEQTANRDFVRQLIIHWQTFGGWRLVELTASLPLEVRRALRRLAFDDAGDKRILRTAYNTEDRRVVSNDPDFWDPRDSDRRSVGRPSAPVAVLCRERLGVTVSTLTEFVEELAEGRA
jgi:hypothetical protein